MEKELRLNKVPRKRLHSGSYSSFSQPEMLNFFISEIFSDQKMFLEKEFRAKLNGYKTQDRKKEKYNKDEFISLVELTRKLVASSLKCFYCQNEIYIAYDNALEPLQWTLERIDNDIGHNYGNVEIACLACNRKRRCIFHEKFRFTKQTVLVKLTD